MNADTLVAKPNCDCHGEPMYWNKDVDCKAGGFWKCPVKARDGSQRYRAVHLEELRQYQRRWAQTHRASRRETFRRWEAANPVKVKIRAAKARARRAGVTEHEPWTREEVWERGGGRCHICTELLDPRSWHADHVVPLARGGADRLDNLLPAHPSCNTSKGARVA